MFGLREFAIAGLTLGAIATLGSQFGVACLAQSPNPNQTSMMLYRVVTLGNGQQFVVTQSGLQIPLPPPGVDPRSQELSVYRDPQGNFWYYDRNGAPVKVTAGQIQWKISQLFGNAQQPVQQTTNVYQQSPSSGSSALTTGVAAATGAAVGGLVAGACNDNYYYGVPYGVPIYRAGTRAYYYNNLGKPVYVNNSTHTNTMINTWNKQTNWNNQLQGWQQKKNYRDGGLVRTFDGTGARPYSPAVSPNDRHFDRNKFGRDDNNRFGKDDGRRYDGKHDRRFDGKHDGRRANDDRSSGGFDRGEHGRFNAQAHGGNAGGRRGGGHGGGRRR
jgi:hypothetical protein